MKKFNIKKMILIAALSFIAFAANAFYVTTSCGATYNVIGCETMEDVIETVDALESLCP